MSKIVEMAHDLCRGVDANPVIIASGTSTAWLTTPAAWLGKFVEISSIGCDTYIRWSTTTAPQVDKSTTSTITSNAFSAYSGKEPHLVIPAGTSKHDRVKVTSGFFAYISSATGGLIYITLASGDST